MISFWLSKPFGWDTAALNAAMWVSKLCWKKSQHTKRKTTSDWVMIKGYCTSDAVVIWDKDTLLIFLIFCFIPFTAIVNIHPEKQNRNVNFLRSSHSVLHYDKSPPKLWILWKDKKNSACIFSCLLQMFDIEQMTLCALQTIAVGQKYLLHSERLHQSS